MQLISTLLLLLAAALPGAWAGAGGDARDSRPAPVLKRWPHEKKLEKDAVLSERAAPVGRMLGDRVGRLRHAFEPPSPSADSLRLPSRPRAGEVKEKRFKSAIVPMSKLADDKAGAVNWEVEPKGPTELWYDRAKKAINQVLVGTVSVEQFMGAAEAGMSPKTSRVALKRGVDRLIAKDGLAQDQDKRLILFQRFLDDLDRIGQLLPSLKSGIERPDVSDGRYVSGTSPPARRTTFITTLLGVVLPWLDQNVGPVENKASCTAAQYQSLRSLWTALNPAGVYPDLAFVLAGLLSDNPYLAPALPKAKPQATALRSSLNAIRQDYQNGLGFNAIHLELLNQLVWQPLAAACADGA